MVKEELIITYLSKLAQVRDEIGSVGETISPADLMILSLLGLQKSRHSFQDVVNFIDKLRDWDILWSNLVQEEIRRNTRDGVSSGT